jgi:predicted glycoside hydrolase/deacetylase ChbG (UPF0249 family)
MKLLIVCADDYAASPEISEAIRILLKMRRLSAVSCMTDVPDWEIEGSRLLQNNAPIHSIDADIGLHFQLTPLLYANTPRNRDKKPLLDLIGAALLGRLDLDWVKACLEQQLDRFEAVVGCGPDFVDGHQHVHLFPGIREVLLEVLSGRYSTQPPWIRRVNPGCMDWPSYFYFKNILLRLLGLGFHQAVIRQGFALSPDFYGVYDLNIHTDFERHMAHWIKQVDHAGLVMCHPGLRSMSDPDGLSEIRMREFEYLSSPAFLSLCEIQGVQISRLK